MYYDIDNTWKVEAREEYGLRLLERAIKRAGASSSEEGERLYRSKERKVSWSMETYMNQSFQETYVKVKTPQRYCETFNMLEHFDLSDMNIVSIGGGPGIELLAMKDLGVRSCSSLDLPFWRSMAERMGNEFREFDMFKDDVTTFLKEGKNTIFLSYVYSNYLDSEEGMKLVFSWFNHVDHIFINDRGILKSLNGVRNVYRMNAYDDDSSICITRDHLDTWQRPMFNVFHRPKPHLIAFTDDVKEAAERGVEAIPPSDAFVRLSSLPRSIAIVDIFSISDHELKKLRFKKLYFMKVGDANVDNQFKHARFRGIKYAKPPKI